VAGVSKRGTSVSHQWKAFSAASNTAANGSQRRANRRVAGESGANTVVRVASSQPNAA
jgi:hypothetical protein